MTTVYFVRHAQPNFNNHDDLTRELTAQGLKDSKRVTEFLWDKGIDVILSSSYKRAIDTIKDFADAKKIEIKCIADFRERKVGNAWIEDFEDSFGYNEFEEIKNRMPWIVKISFDRNQCLEIQKCNILS